MPETNSQKLHLEHQNDEGQKSASIGKYDTEDDVKRRYSEVALKASKKERVELFQSLVSTEAQEKWNEAKPIFYQENRTAPTIIELDQSIQTLFPKEFYENPTHWIESQKNIERGRHSEKILPSGTAIKELFFFVPYDRSKVKKFILQGMDNANLSVVSKRMPKNLLNQPDKELAIGLMAYQKGIPTAKPLGMVRHFGNCYLFWEKINGISFLELLLQDDSVWVWDSNGEKFYSNFGDIQQNILLERGVPEKKVQWIAQRRQDIIDEKKILFKYAQFFSVLCTYFPRDKIILYGRKDYDKFIAQWRKDMPYHPRRHEIESIVFKQMETLGVKPENYFRSYEDAKNEYGKNPDLDISNLTNVLIPNPKKEKKLCRDLSVLVYGFDPWKEKANLEKMIRKHKIPHNDLNNRNLIIPWNEQSNAPDIKEGSPKMYVIDWESM